MLTQSLAEKIVREVRKLLDEDIIVTNTEGIIIASTDPSRVLNFHEGAKIACQNKKSLIITKEDEKVLQGVKAGINLPIFFQGEVLGIIGITGEPEKVKRFGEIIRKMTELLISENHYAEQFDWQSRSIESFLLDWIQRKEWTDAFLNKAKFLNIDLRVNRQIFIAEMSNDFNYLRRDVWLSILSWQGKSERDIISRWGSNRILYVAAIDDTCKQVKMKAEKFHQYLQSLLQNEVHLGVGLASPPKKIYQSFHQAERALHISLKTNKKLVFDEELALEIVLDEVTDKTKKEFILRTIYPLLQEKELMLTIRTLIDHNFSLKETAKSLYIHINTLHYRLKKVKEKTKLNPRKIDDLFLLYLAFRFLDEEDC